MLQERVRVAPNSSAFMRRTQTGWTTISWQNFNEQVVHIAAGLIGLGLKNEERVAIASMTRYEWVAADLGILTAGGAVTTVYAQTEPDDVAYILNDSETKFVFAENEEQLTKLRNRKHQIPNVKKVIVFEGRGDGDWVISLDELEEMGRQQLRSTPKLVSDRIETIKSENLATLMYTSGTTGRPKGVVLLHSNWAFEGATIETLGILRSDDVQMLWLPLAHSFGSVLLAAQLQIGFTTAVDGQVDRLVENLSFVKPTFMGAVPRIFEKIYAKVTGDVEHEGGAKAKIFNWALNVGVTAAKAKRLQGIEPDRSTKAQLAIANKLVFSKLQKRMGGRIRFFVSGAAALSTDVAWFFEAAGLTILEGYGLTETSAATTLNRPHSVGIGTVGEIFNGMEIKLDTDGEILIKGPGVMKGYHNLPDETAKCFTSDGWFRTGDIGEIDELGRVKITDRKKDLVKTSNGKFVALSFIESKYKGITKIASNMIVQAMNRPYVSALVAVDADSLKTFAEQRKLEGSYSSLLRDKTVTDQIAGEIDQLNRTLNPWEQVKEFRVLPTDLAIESGELTPSMKVKRDAVGKRYQSLIEEMYANK
jgi:long-chain acyl-CoA synthetase